MQNCCFVTFSVKVQQWVGLINEIMNVKSWIVLKWNYCYSVIAWLESMTRLTIFGNSHSTRVTLRKIVTRLTFLTESLDSTRVTVYDSCQSHFYKISEFLMDKPSSFAHKKWAFFASVMIKIGGNFLFCRLVVLWCILKIKCPQLAYWDFAFTEGSAGHNTLTPYGGFM